ncbi:hypothetical protein [Rhodobaculum claviforme]|uniref:PPM-type phosphatase domain-containing protein n=1 Tax=Rhodobaculum claviforme TaxID=1549854 RepID=A0A934TI63_9RHOB|nr:hypothetical protein [Rhodobaculum claviforme]MBK5926320.1 hypothetical protein [Rhodobaculum claviforme]
MIAVLERHTRSRTADGTGNADRLLVADGICAVIDGATPKPGQDPAAAARLAACIAEALRSAHAAPDAGALVAAVTGRVRAQGPWDASAAMVVCVDALRQVIRVGDGHLAIDGVAHVGTKPVDRLLAEVRSLYLRLCPAPDTDHDPGRAVIEPLLIAQAGLHNRTDLPPYGYGCIDGSDVPARFIEVWDIPPGAEVVLCSDGYPHPAATLAEAEAQLARALAADPQCVGVLKGTKGLRPGQVSFDDRSYLRMRISD